MIIRKLRIVREEIIEGVVEVREGTEKRDEKRKRDTRWRNIVTDRGQVTLFIHLGF